MVLTRDDEQPSIPGTSSAFNNPGLRGLISRRAGYKSQLTSFRRYVEDLQPENDLYELKVRLSRMERVFDKFDELQAEIEGIGHVDEEREAFEDTYYQYTARASRMIEGSQRARSDSSIGVNGRSNTQTPDSQNSAAVKLPTLHLPTFTGCYDKWTSFYGSFKAVIHDNDKIPDVQKLQYLRSCLKDGALSAIEELDTVPESYNIAWQLLQERFDNKRVIVQAHVKLLFELPAAGRDAGALRKMVDDVQKHVRALKSLGLPTEHWGAPLIWSLTNKMDRDTFHEWEKKCSGNRLPSFEEMLEFLKDRCQFLESVQGRVSSGAGPSNQPLRDANKRPDQRPRPRPQVLVGLEKATAKCGMCAGEHQLYNCARFLGLTPGLRAQEVKKIGACYNCLRDSHLANNCKSIACRKCQRRHHTLLHRDEEAPETVTSMMIEAPSQVILVTALIIMKDAQGHGHYSRVLLDGASQVNLIRRSFAQSCGFVLKPIDLSVMGLAERETPVEDYVTVSIESRIQAYSKVLHFMLVDRVTGKVPSSPISLGTDNIDEGIQLADPNYALPGEVDALISADTFYELLGSGRVELAQGKIRLIETPLGWIVTGRSLPTREFGSACLMMNCTDADALTRFWEIEEVPSARALSQQDVDCERHYREKVQRCGDGRYMVRLPFNGRESELGLSYANAKRRFAQLERRFFRDPELRSSYTKFMREYIGLGHMTLSTNNVDEGCYIPHHAVFKRDSVTSKLRVVFDASAKTESGVSLNDTLMVGPTVQDDMFVVIGRFRGYAFAITADIEKMYRQVRLHPQDCKFQKILWRETEFEPLGTYVLNTVTYGTASASFLATRTLRQLAEDERVASPLAAEVMSRDFYVDDLLTGSNTFEMAKRIREQVQETAQRGGFHLRKWAASDPRLLNDLQGNIVDSDLPIMGTIHKTLGLWWNPEYDVLSYRIDMERRQTYTKRMMLSQVARIFDPLGLLGPVVVTTKLIIKALWEAKLDWDDPVPDSIGNQFRELCDHSAMIGGWSIPRCVVAMGASEYELHEFTDASERAYGACIYLKSWDEQRLPRVMLVASKSKVAPTKTITIPRLELCAALLLSRLYKSLDGISQLECRATHFWSDSTIVLTWIQTPPYTLKIFVANRVSEIISNTNCTDWKHVPSEFNPADFLSREQKISDFIENRMWVSGPSWLLQDRECWPPQPHLGEPLEIRKTATVALATAGVEIFKRFSNFTKLKHVTAFMLRFVRNARIPKHRAEDRQVGPLSIAERKEALKHLLRLMQRHEFSEEFHALETSREIRKGSALRALSPFLDENKLLRVGGRISKASINWDQAHPIVLARGHPLTHLIIEDVHIRQMHSGLNGTLYGVRMAFWPVDGRISVKRVIRNCMNCFRAKPTKIDYRMGQLPVSRVMTQRPFGTVGVDYCGPFFVKEKRKRNRGRVKVYICIFICFAVKAVHIELAGDMTTETFLGCLRRFVARRGKPSVIYSDNGSNFVGANRELNEVVQSREHQEEVQEFLARQSIRWVFSPPRTPHFGGLWEAAVKSMKGHLIRTIGDSLFTYEELETFVVEVEAILNSRPLTPISSDPNDYAALTPAHFIIGDSLMAVPEKIVAETRENRLSSWRHITLVKQRFWKRWQREYLTELNRMPKWLKGTPSELRIGQLVLLHDESITPLHWRLGRIISVHPGEDGVIRVVGVKTPKGVFKRGVTKISPLPVK